MAVFNMCTTQSYLRLLLFYVVLIRSNSGLEDLTTMTIESLRARLLSERAISRTAKQRADELAKRVSVILI